MIKCNALQLHDVQEFRTLVCRESFKSERSVFVETNGNIVKFAISSKGGRTTEPYEFMLIKKNIIESFSLEESEFSSRDLKVEYDFINQDVKLLDIARKLDDKEEVKKIIQENFISCRNSNSNWLEIRECMHKKMFDLLFNQLYFKELLKDSVMSEISFICQ